MTIQSSSLRERSKAKRRATIQRTGMRLFAERGYDAATVADIAEAAEVAPRTVSMYFPTKLDIAMSPSTDLAGRLIDALRAVPDAPFSEAVDCWLGGESEMRNPELTALAAAMFDANPALRAVSQSYLVEVSHVAAPALLAESGLAADDTLLPVVVAAVSAAITEYVTRSLDTPSTTDSQRRFMQYLQTIIGAARAPSG